MVNPTTPLVVVASTSWEVSVQIAEEAAGQVRQGDVVRMTASAFPDQPFTGRVTIVAPLVDAQARTLTVKVEPSGSTPPVRGGMSTRIDIPTSVHGDVLLVPKGAVLSTAGQSFLFTVEGGRAHALPIKVGASDYESVEVLAGLDPGVVVITSGQQLAAEGEQVVVLSS
jgi:RND family efflux transporter MFP subunit